MKRLRGAQPGNMNRVKNQPRFFTAALITRLMLEVKDKRGVVNKGDEGKFRRTVDILVNVLVEQALNGEMQALKMIADRIEGSAIATVQYVPLDEKQEADHLAKIHEQVKGKTFDELATLYRETLSEASPTHGRA